jgi:succinate dehydrogenase / fumarate reductase flavoprotein subunit
VLLDPTHLDRDVILTKLPRVYRNMLDLQMLDITKDPIEIAPTAHYFMGGNSLAELLVYGRIVGTAAGVYSRGLKVQIRSAEAVDTAREEIDTLLAGRGFEYVRSMQRDIRDLMSEHVGVIRSEEGLKRGLTKLEAVEARLPDLAVHPDIAGFDDLAHALDLLGSLIAARETNESALARRETRGAHNRSDFPETDSALKVNMVWSLVDGVTQEPIAETPGDIARLMTSTEDIAGGAKR